MKKIFVIILAIIIIGTGIIFTYRSGLFSQQESGDKEKEVMPVGKTIDRIEEKDGVEVFADHDLSEVKEVVSEGKELKVLDTYLEGYFKVRINSDEEGFVDSRYLKTANVDIPLADPEILEDIDKKLLFIVSQEKQQMYVYQLNGDNPEKDYELIKTVDVSTGKEDDPTPNGYFTIKEYRGPWFYNSKYEVGARYFVTYRDSYLLHSVGHDENEEVIPEKKEGLGEKNTHGCIALPLKEAKFVYEEAEEGMLLVINHSPLTPEEIYRGQYLE
ncbi:MAG: L,D-transpeptidase family protein [Bacillota bacterium]